MGRKNAKTPQHSRTLKRFHRQTMKIYLRDFENSVDVEKHRKSFEKEEQRIISRNELGSYVFNLCNKLD
ncbi:4751_t:CDS:2, partial [Funneliformis mosseae]